ncbi:MAG: hypothetical protein H5U02_07055 [Clostridia bacterium]|nr:hypothetical protein [Clostridia bacterium]
MQPVDVIVLTIALCLLGVWYFKKYMVGWGVRWKLPPAVKELEAAGLVLEKYGYRIICCQPRVNTVLELLGRSFNFESRADFVVEKDGEFFVAQSVEGQKISHWLDGPNHMRRLVEMCISCQADGMVLIDTDNDIIYPLQVNVSGPRYKKKVQLFRELSMSVAGLAVGAIVVYMMLK